MKSRGPFLIFIEKFKNNEACCQFLYDSKWKEGYLCRRCGCCESISGRTKFHKRCRVCRYDESATAHTMFHKLKFPIVKAFAIIYQLMTMKKGMSSCEISRQYGIHQETAWIFRKKVNLAILASNEHGEIAAIQKTVDNLVRSVKSKARRKEASAIVTDSKKSPC